MSTPVIAMWKHVDLLQRVRMSIRFALIEISYFSHDIREFVGSKSN